MSYKVNNIPLKDLGFVAGWINGLDGLYALDGLWSLPPRLGKTHHNWEGDIEPYVNGEDINLGKRELTLKVVRKASDLSELSVAIEQLYKVLKDKFTLSHPLHGTFNVGLIAATTGHFKNGWGEIALQLEESNPTISLTPSELPNNAPYGIDGYGFNQLGLVISGIDDRYDLPNFTSLKITQSPLAPSWAPGYRDIQTITIDGTLKAPTYNEFGEKARLLQSVIGSNGMKEVKYFDGFNKKTFCTSGFTINDVRRVSASGDHWAAFKCDLIVV